MRRWCTTGVLQNLYKSRLLSSCTFFLQNSVFLEWAMLGSNQRPLPCESEACSFATVRRYPISAFLSWMAQYPHRGCSLPFAPVVVKLSSDHGLPTTPALQRL